MSSHSAVTESPVSILRIKRKRTEQSLPLDALLIQQAEPSSKRRRNVEPGSADPAPAPSRAIFRFAETVSSNSFDTANQTKQITDRITSFAKLPPVAPALRRVSSNNAIRHALNAPSSPSRKLPSQARAARAAAEATAQAGPSDGVNATKRQGKVDEFHQEAKRARYRIIEKARASVGQAPEVVDSYRGPRPPQVLTASEMTRAPAAKIYDAIEEDQFDRPTRANILRTPFDDSGDSDELMSSFVPMLQEYLSLQDPLASPDRASQGGPPLAVEPSTPPEDEFVYDLYYRSEHPMAVSTTDPNMLGPTSASDDVGSLAGLQRIGELAGLDEDEILNDELSSEEEDEADQDSNDEGDYRNDYPEGEDDYSDSEDDDGDRPSWSD